MNLIASQADRTTPTNLIFSDVFKNSFHAMFLISATPQHSLRCVTRYFAFSGGVYPPKVFEEIFPSIRSLFRLKPKGKVNFPWIFEEVTVSIPLGPCVGAPGFVVALRSSICKRFQPPWPPLQTLSFVNKPASLSRHFHMAEDSSVKL